MFALLGYVGMFLILCAFLGNVLQFLRSTSVFYLALNFLGAIFLVFYAYFLASWPFFVLNIMWSLAALYEYYHIHHKKTRKHRY